MYCILFLEIYALQSIHCVLQSVLNDMYPMDCVNNKNNKLFINKSGQSVPQHVNKCNVITIGGVFLALIHNVHLSAHNCHIV